MQRCHSAVISESSWLASSNQSRQSEVTVHKVNELHLGVNRLLTPVLLFAMVTWGPFFDFLSGCK